MMGSSRSRNSLWAARTMAVWKAWSRLSAVPARPDAPLHRRSLLQNVGELLRGGPAAGPGRRSVARTWSAAQTDPAAVPGPVPGWRSRSRRSPPPAERQRCPCPGAPPAPPGPPGCGWPPGGWPGSPPAAGPAPVHWAASHRGWSCCSTTMVVYRRSAVCWDKFCLGMKILLLLSTVDVIFVDCFSLGNRHGFPPPALF